MMDTSEILREIQVVCKCKGVKYRTIRNAIQAGANTIEEIRKKTTANTGCGKYCTEKILEMINLYKNK